MKKILSLIIVFVVALNFTACGTNTDYTSGDNQSPTESSAETISGKVTAIDGTTVTIAIITQESGQNAESEQQGETPPEIPSGDSQQSETSSEIISVSSQQGETPTDKPDGESSQDEAVPDKPDGESQQGETVPDKPDGESQQGETVPDKPDGESQQGETVPDKPDGESQQGETVPDKPDGESQQGETVPDKPDGESQTGNTQNAPGVSLTGETRTIEITDTSVLYKTESGSEVSASLSDIAVGSILTVTYNEKSVITKILISDESNFNDNNGGGQNAPGGSTSDVVYGGDTEITSSAEQSDKTYTSDTADQSALLISTSENVTVNNPTVSKTGDSDGGDNCNFYGQNATVLVKGGSTTTITGGTVTSDANGANGVFSYGGNGGQNGAEGDGTTVIISDTVITTKGDGSGGIMTTGGGKTQASNLTVTTSGQSSAAIRTDRGGGTVTVTGGTYTTNGLGSPAIYSTADITVTDAELVSTLSEGVCIEGLNSIELNNSNLTANNTKCNGNATFYDTIMIYQSMSGDADSGTSSFTMNGGSLTSKNGHVFHVTNTSAIISLNGVTIVNEDSENILLSVCDDGWSGGSNTAVLNAENQILNGEIKVGSNSSLTMTLSGESSFTGCISGDITNASGKTVSTTVGSVSVTLSDTSTWALTADTYISSFSGNASNVISNGYTLYVNGVALEGTK